jgi:hypothetical protein
MRTGRKRHANAKRTPSGRVSRAAPGIHPETLAVREAELQKAGIILAWTEIEGGRSVPKRAADDRLSGYTLGRLYLRHQQDKGNPGGISQSQFESGEAWASLCIARKSLDDSQRLGVKSPFANMVKSETPPDSLELVFAPRVVQTETDDERALRIKARWNACDRAIDEECRGYSHKVKQVMLGVCIENWALEQITEADFGMLRTGLNLVGKVLR